MSGIAGIIRFDGVPVAPELVEKMTAAMRYRGPDGIKHWASGPAALGQCMMYTTQESLEETQPLANEDESLVLVMDGRVDNWAELRRNLLANGALLRDRSDAEMALRAYEKWGRDCLRHLEGDYAFVIWDTRNRRAFCARDRVGNKPFHYHWDGKTLSFSSELHAILALPWVKQELNTGMIAQYLSDEWYSRDETLWKGISRLEAAHSLVVGERGLGVQQYWQPSACEKLPYTREEEYAEHYRALLINIVDRMSRTHRPLACEVSGGLDSSAIFSVAEHLRRQHRLRAPSVDGYTLDFHFDENANELAYVQAVEEHLGTQVQRIPPTRMPLSWYSDSAAHYREFPGYPNGVMGLGIRQAARRAGGRVLLTGAGGDEWLVGERTYYADEIANGNWRELFRSLKVDASEAGMAKAAWWLFRTGLVPFLPASLKKSLRALLAARQKPELDRLAWLAPEMKNALIEMRSRHAPLPSRADGQLGLRVLDSYKDHAYVTLAREMEERMAASVGIELRSPFWDAKIIQFAYSTPLQFRLRGYTDKAVHRRAMTGFLPEEVLSRPTKADFSIMIDSQLHEMSDEFTRVLPNQLGAWVESDRVVALYRAFEAGGLDQASRARWRLWALFGCGTLVSGKTAN